MNNMSTMAYALDNKWNEPLIIQRNKKIDKIYLQADRKRGEITPRFADTTTIDDIIGVSSLSFYAHLVLVRVREIIIFFMSVFRC